MRSSVQQSSPWPHSPRRPLKPAFLGAAVVCGAALLAACGDSPEPGPDAITVNGSVVDEYLEPQPRLGVLVGGRPPVTTDSDGRFSVSGVIVPYDLVVALASERGALIYTRLTRSDPLVVVPPSPFSQAHHGAYFWGSVYGGTGLPVPDNHRTSVLFESPETRSVGAGPSYRLQPQWLGPTTTTGTLHALQWQFDPTSGLPVAYTGYGSVPGLDLSDGAYFEGPPVTMASPVAAGAINGSVTVPDGFVLSRKSMRARFEASSTLPAAWEIATDSGGSTSFTYVTPDLPGATFALSARAVAGPAYGEVVKTGISASAGDVTLTIPTPPMLLAPENGSTSVNGATQFSWRRMSGAVYLLAIRYNGRDIIIPPPLNYYAFTVDTTFTVPDLSAFGFGYYRGTSYVWEVFGWAPFASVDEILVPTWFIPQGDGRFARSAPRTFTTAR